MTSELAAVTQAPRESVLETLMRWVPEYAPQGVERRAVREMRLVA
jgi:hypothetical protein